MRATASKTSAFRFCALVGVSSPCQPCFLPEKFFLERAPIKHLLQPLDGPSRKDSLPQNYCISYTHVRTASLNLVRLFAFKLLHVSRFELGVCGCWREIAQRPPVPWRYKVRVLILNLGVAWRWLPSPTPWPVYLREGSPLPIVMESVWAPGAVWMDVDGIISLDRTWYRTPNRATHSESAYMLDQW